jgi:hypothetical protein
MLCLVITKRCKSWVCWLRLKLRNLRLWICIRILTSWLNLLNSCRPRFKVKERNLLLILIFMHLFKLTLLLNTWGILLLVTISCSICFLIPLFIFRWLRLTLFLFLLNRLLVVFSLLKSFLMFHEFFVIHHSWT